MADIRTSTWPATVDSIAQIAEGERPAKSYKVAVLIDWYNKFVASYWNNTIGLVVPAGGLTVTGTTGITGAVTITSPANATVPLTVNGYSTSHSANLVSVFDFAGGTNVFKIESTGNITVTKEAPANAFLFAIATNAHSMWLGSGNTTTSARIRLNGAAFSTNGAVYIEAGNVSGGDIALITNNNVTQLTALYAGGVTVANLLTASGGVTVAAAQALTVTSGATSLTGLAAGSSTACLIATGADSNVGLILRRNSATQSGDLLQLQSSAPAVLSCFNKDGFLAVGATATAWPIYAVGASTSFQAVFAPLTTNNASKSTRIGALPYTTTNPCTLLFLNAASAAVSYLSIGGGTSSGYATTAIGFYTAADGTTTTGTERARINADGIGILLASARYLYQETPGTIADGDWCHYISGTDLVFERRESSAWVEKGRMRA